MKSANNYSKTLWMGDIDNWMDEKFIYQTFSELAPVKGVKVMRDRNTGMTLGYGFVEFENTETAKTVLFNCNGKTIPNTNKLFKLNWASFGSGKTNLNSKVLDNSNMNISGFISENMNSPDYSIYVGDLDQSVTESLLKDFFLKFYDSVISTKIVLDPVTKSSKGYGFVKFKDYDQSQRALNEMNGKLLINKTMKTNQAAWKKNTSQESNLSSKNICNQNSFYNGNQQNINSNTPFNNSGSNLSQNYFNSYNVNDGYASQMYQNQYHQNYLNNLYQTYYNQSPSYNFPRNNTNNPSETCNIDNSFRNYENNMINNQNIYSNQQILPQFQNSVSNQLQNTNSNSASNKI